MNNHNELLLKIETVVEPVLSEEDFELVDLEFQKESRGLVLRLFVDRREGAITLRDCGNISERVGRILDHADVIKEAYHLEISSPGIERRLRKPRDFKRFIDFMIAVKTLEPVRGRRNINGVLRRATDDAFMLEADEQLYEITYSNLSKAHLIVDVAL